MQDQPVKALAALQPVAESAGQIIRQKAPDNLEFSFPTLSAFATPNSQFYVRSHFSQPEMDRDSWRLTVEGCVDEAMSFSFDDLLKMPATTRYATLECAGNGRVFLAPKVNGAQWELGAVSNAEWTGVLLSELLSRMRLTSAAIELIFEGADKGEPDETPKPPGQIHYAHSIPLSKAGDTLLAYRMNGEELPPSHGAPLRAVVGGWYGMASVKWLTRIVISGDPFNGYFQSVDYAYWEDQAGLPVRVPITEMKAKAQIARPAYNEVVAAGSEYRVIGAAWTGESNVSKVEISTDGGKTYSQATLLGEPIPHTWRFWDYQWKIPAKLGKHILMARATDTAGNTQPQTRDKHFGSYVITHTLPIEVEVR